MLKKKRESKFAHAAHIKRHTEGTSNEISFSVLDKAKSELDGEKAGVPRSTGFWPGVISLFTLPGRRKAVATPRREKGLHLSNGEFVSTEADAAKEGRLLLGASAGLPVKGKDKEASAPTSVEAESKKQAPSPGVTVATPAAAPVVKRKAEPASEQAWRTPVDEVARRKARRRRGKIIVGGLTAVAVTALVAVGGFWLYERYTEQQDMHEQLMASISAVEAADETVLAVDEFVVALANGSAGDLSVENLQPTIDGLVSSLPEASEKLDEADRFVETALAGLPESVDREAAYQVESCIAARRDMIANAERILSASSTAASSADALRAAWDVLLQSDTPARDAAALLSEMTEENVWESIDLTNESLSLLAQADALFAQIGDSDPLVDVSDYRTYIAKRVEALQCANASNQAFLDRAKDEMVAQNDAYNAFDAEAAALAQTLPTDPAARAEESLSVSTESFESDYFDARSRAGAADSFLRDYLGAQGK